VYCAEQNRKSVTMQQLAANDIPQAPPVVKLTQALKPVLADSTESASSVSTSSSSSSSSSGLLFPTLIFDPSWAIPDVPINPGPIDQTVSPGLMLGAPVQTAGDAKSVGKLGSHIFNIGIAMLRLEHATQSKPHPMLTCGGLVQVIPYIPHWWKDVPNHDT